MTAIWTYLAAHQTISILVTYYILSAAVGSLPMPDIASGKFYRWFFGFSNALGANLARVWASKLPKDEANQVAPKSS